MQDRLKKLIACMGLNQSKFAIRIGITRPEINKILNGKRNLTEGMIGRIVARTGVNENWLRNNEGEMFALAAPESMTIQTPFEYAQAQGCNETISRLFARYCALPKEGKEAFEKIVDALLVEKTVAPTPTSSRIVVNNATAERGDAVINQMFRN